MKIASFCQSRIEQIVEAIFLVNWSVFKTHIGPWNLYGSPCYYQKAIKRSNATLWKFAVNLICFFSFQMTISNSVTLSSISSEPFLLARQRQQLTWIFFWNGIYLKKVLMGHHSSLLSVTDWHLIDNFRRVIIAISRWKGKFDTQGL